MDPEIEEMRRILVEVARRRGVVHYGPLGERFGLDMANPADRKRIGYMLGEISRFEVGQGRPMLSSVVVLAGEGGGTPGDGFRKLGDQLGRVLPSEDDRAFGVREMNLTHDCWASGACA